VATEREVEKVSGDVDSVDEATFQRAFSAVLRQDGERFAWLAELDRGLHPRPAGMSTGS
jgi:hypothetical protein